LFYLTLRADKGRVFAFAVTTLTMLNAQVFFWSTQIITEGLSLFFVILTLYLLRGNGRYYWLGAGIAMALTFASRYPVFLQVVVIFIIEAVVRRNVKQIVVAVAGLAAVLTLIVSLVYTKTETFTIAITRDSQVGMLSTYYLENSLEIFGPVFLLIPVAFLFRKTYADKNNYVFIAWFIVAFLFWSANAENHQARFMIQLMPAAYFLAMLTLYNLWTSDVLSKRIFSISKRPATSNI
jgi:4-amino-4-deoxy-L-arabinose transferase-like glycosyltransferase